MSKHYIIKYTIHFEKNFMKIPKNMRNKVFNSIKELEQYPYTSKNVKKLSSLKIGCWRKRMGNYRIRYDINGQEIILYSVKHRKDINK